MVKPSKLLPPDPRPWTADPESRKQRKQTEKEVGGFDWGQALALGLIGATVVFGIDKSLRRTEEKHEEEDRREERRRQRESQSRSSRARRSSQSQAGYGRDRYDGDERNDDFDDREYYDRYYDEREAIRAARDYSREPARAPESIRSLRDDRSEYERSEYIRAVDQFDRDYGYGRRYEEHKRSQSNPASRSRHSNW
ncbi:hypothetical protein CPLU01_04461 [Colletotrichum plurivorum]|uniref:Uncharacterized protein n=1 Tax=Colletotrichum plurivorum TaxID=2175906 RepID=A0A8H6NJW5_9PEZI|nr:hypothetical protein CPLU01_04461 [Colletotrichum plurivorum]